MTDVDTALRALRDHVLSEADYRPRHYPEGMPYSLEEFVPFNPPPIPEELLWDLDDLREKVDGADFILGHALHAIKERAPLWHPDVVACFGPPTNG